MIAVSAVLLSAAAWLVSRSGRLEADRRVEEVVGAIAAGRIDEADRLVQDWLGQAPDDPEALAWASRVALAADRPLEAADFARRAQQRGLDRSELRDVEGIALVRAGKPAEAEPLLRAHLAESDRPEPMAAQALAEAGLATFRLGTARDALARWRRDAPNDPRPWMLEAEVAERVGDPPETIAGHYREALRRDPERDEARSRLADALRLAGRHDEAAREYRKYLDRNPDDADALASAGLNELARGRVDEAERLLTGALERAPNDLDALKGIARLLQQTGRIEEALSRFEQAAEVEPGDAEIAYQRSLLLARLGRREEAERMRKRSEELRAEADEIARIRDELVRDPNKVDLQYEAARWLIEHGHVEEGLRWAEKALQALPGHRPTCLLLAEHYEAAGQADLASYYRWQADPPDDESAPASR
ncbi:tetratricopeptide repeat protein [Tautonia sociabilis]|nr:tetratricopeptide repeat protein [Tautonia sociabilis]